MHLNEMTITPHLTSDSESTGNMSTPNNRTTVNIENVINISRDGYLTTETTQNINQASPSPSVRSTTISIASIESDAVSSVIESDIDEYEDTKTGCMVKKLGQQTAHPADNNGSIPNISPEIAILLGQHIEKDVPSSNGPQIASLSLTNSTDVTFGTKKYHRGPVTIQQILIEKPTRNDGSHPAFDNSNDCQSSAARTRKPECEIRRGNTTLSPMYKYALQHKTAILTLIIVILTLLIGTIVWTTTFILKDDILHDVDQHPKLISRNAWLAQPPNVPSADLEKPVFRVIITHTSTQNCSTKAMCIFQTRFIQTFDIESTSFDDIRYNFLVGGDGNVYVGRGWDKVGAHTKGYNEYSVGIAFIGTFNQWAPPEQQLNAVKWLLDEGVRLNKLAPDFSLYGSRQLDVSDGPGDALYAIITKWPNWSSEI